MASFFDSGKRPPLWALSQFTPMRFFPTSAIILNCWSFRKRSPSALPDLEAWVALGKLRLRGPNPGDWWEYDRSGQVHSSYDKHWGESLLLTFPIGKWALLPAEKSRLTDFVATWARRYL